jgi:hypothetical protein
MSTAKCDRISTAGTTPGMMLSNMSTIPKYSDAHTLVALYSWCCLCTLLYLKKCFGQRRPPNSLQLSEVTYNLAGVSDGMQTCGSRW